MTKCPLCGYNEQAPASLMNNVMNEYVNTDTLEVVTMNNAKQQVEIKADEDKGIKGVNFIRRDLHQGWLANGKSFEPKVEKLPIKENPANTAQTTGAPTKTTVAQDLAKAQTTQP